MNVFHGVQFAPRPIVHAGSEAATENRDGFFERLADNVFPCFHAILGFDVVPQLVNQLLAKKLDS